MGRVVYVMMVIVCYVCLCIICCGMLSSCIVATVRFNITLGILASRHFVLYVIYSDVYVWPAGRSLV